jgi:NMT1/THI5 like
MSSLDQPLLLANSNYHVGQQMSIRVAEEQGYFRDEGLAAYDYDWRGLLPGPLEKEGLALVMKEHGVDVATAVDLHSALHQRVRGADLYIVGGWRYNPTSSRLFGGKQVTALAQLRGKRIGTREAGDLGQRFVARQLRKVGIDPDREIEWQYSRAFAYGHDASHLDLLRLGQVDAMLSQPPHARLLEEEGYPVLLDPWQVYGGARVDKVVVATGRTVERRAAELAAFLRANIRAFWFMRDLANMPYLQALEVRLRARSRNDDEQQVRMLNRVEKVEGWALPISGGIARETVEQVIADIVESGELERPLAVEEVLRDGPVKAAYEELTGRPALQAAHQKALAAVQRWRY